MLAIARALAAARGERDLTALHLAIGLLREAENAAVAALHHQGVALGALRHDLEHALGDPPGGTHLDEVVLPASPGEARLVTASRVASAARGDEHIGPEHLLLAVLADPEGLAASVLAQHGVTADATLAAYAALIHRH